MLSELNTNHCYNSFIDNISLVCCNITPKKKNLDIACHIFLEIVKL